MNQLCLTLGLAARHWNNRGTQTLYAKFPFTTKQDLRDNYPFGMFAVPQEQIVRVHASSGTTGQPTVVGYTQQDIQTWSDVVARSLRAAGLSAKDTIQVSYGYGLFTGGLGAHYGVERLGATVIPMSGGQTERQAQLIHDFFSKRGYSDAAIRAGALGCAALIIPSVLFTQVDNLYLSFALIFVAMFFSTFPIPASAAATQMLTPNQLRAQVSAKFLLISNLIALGVGTTAVALITDNYFENTLIVGNSISIVNAVAGVIGVFLLYKGCRYYRDSIQLEKLN